MTSKWGGRTEMDSLLGNSANQRAQLGRGGSTQVLCFLIQNFLPSQLTFPGLLINLIDQVVGMDLYYNTPY